MLKISTYLFANDLAEALKSDVKNNRTSREVMNNYGVSVYFPHKAVPVP